MKIEFHKMQALGNDFILIDAIRHPVTLNAEQIKFLCARRHGIGCDQLLIVSSAVKPQVFPVRIFNANGSEAGQCGNGLRAIASFLKEVHQIPDSAFQLEVLGKPYQIKISESSIAVNLGEPILDPNEIPANFCEQQTYYSIVVAHKEYEAALLSLGNPHCVIEALNLDNIPLNIVGEALNRSELFPQGVNVEFFKIVEDDHIKLRVYERGVGETLACGSGACAAVACGRLWHRLDRKVTVEMQTGILQIEEINDEYWLSGEVKYVFSGAIEL